MTTEELRRLIEDELERPAGEPDDNSYHQGYDDALHWVLQRIDGEV